jgi:P27 family predicted phage terminase small subunit
MPARPVPNAMRLLSGYPDRSRNLTVGIGQPDPPSYLPRVAKAEWRRVIKLASAYPTWIQRADQATLEAYCLSYAVFRAAAEALTRGGATVPGRSSADLSTARAVKNPAVVAFKAASTELRFWIKELGFSPDSRPKVDLGNSEIPDENSPFDI